MPQMAPSAWEMIMMANSFNFMTLLLYTMMKNTEKSKEHSTILESKIWDFF